ncbi:MAG: hypothetical protein HY855_16705 [Burkholderiales bacterium]|nr:hypothetical protein [Burkholderiales bacterium]
MDSLLPFFAADFPDQPAWVWLGFVGVVAALLARGLVSLWQARGPAALAAPR